MKLNLGSHSSLVVQTPWKRKFLPWLLVDALALTALLALPTISPATVKAGHRTAKAANKGMAAVYPWSFQNGHGDSHKLAIQSAEEVARRAGYASVPRHDSSLGWKSKGYGKVTFGVLPSTSQLEAFGKSMHVRRVLYGSVSWHTRSIWVDLGPRTISTATVNAYVFDVTTDRVVYKKLNVHGRSDEKENLYKDAADVLFTPLVTAVSGGPATPQEQRAAQIALGRGYHDWAMGMAK